MVEMREKRAEREAAKEAREAAKKARRGEGGNGAKADGEGRRSRAEGEAERRRAAASRPPQTRAHQARPARASAERRDDASQLAGRVFITLEGIDRSGKTTQAELLADALGPETLLLREPGGTEAGERIRELLKDPALELDPRAELLLFCAARAELVARGDRARRSRPAATSSATASSTRRVAYQGAGARARASSWSRG